MVRDLSSECGHTPPSSALSFGARAAGASFHICYDVVSHPPEGGTERAGVGTAGACGREATAHRPETRSCPGSPQHPAPGIMHTRPGAQGGSRGCWRHEAAASLQDGLPGWPPAGRVNTDRRPACLRARRGRGEAPGQPRLGCPQGLGQLRLPPSPGQSTHSLTTQLSSRLWPPGLCPPTIKCTPTTVTTPADAPDLQGFPGQRPLKWEPRAGVTQS